MSKQLVGRQVQQHMGATEMALHVVMIFFTIGLWYPVYKHRKNVFERTTNVYAA